MSKKSGDHDVFVSEDGEGFGDALAQLADALNLQHISEREGTFPDAAQHFGTKFLITTTRALPLQALLPTALTPTY
jgi:hypothetical protein